MTETTSVDELTYEQALTELEDITRQMEETPPSLEETLALYERGQALAKRCTELLEQAELRIRQLSGEELDDLAGE